MKGRTSVTLSDLIPVKSYKIRNVYFCLRKLASQAWVVKDICDTDLSVLKEFTESSHSMALHILPYESEQL